MTVISETKYAVRPVKPQPILSVAKDADLAKMTGQKPADVKNAFGDIISASIKEAVQVERCDKVASKTKAVAPKVKASPAGKNVPTRSTVKRMTEHEAMLDAQHAALEESSFAERTTWKEGDVQVLAGVTSVVAAKKPVPPTTELAAQFKKAEFRLVKVEDVGGVKVYGYQHKDGRGAIYSVDPDGGELWQVLAANGERYTSTTSKAGKPILLSYALLASSKAAQNRQAHRLSQIDRGVKMEAAKAAEEKAAEKVALPAPSVVRALNQLALLSGQTFDVNKLKGDKYYTARVQMVKRLTGAQKVLVKDTGVQAVIKAFHDAVKPAGKTYEKLHADFVAKAKAITIASRVKKSKATREDQKLIAAAKRATFLERAVPGTILPGSEPLTKKQQREQDEEDRRTLKEELAVKPATMIVKKRDDGMEEIVVTYANLNGAAKEDVGQWKPRIDGSSVMVRENTLTGEVILQVECANSQGAISVYNNGMRVVSGLVGPETLAKFKKIENIDVVAAASSLLSRPEISLVAHRHLTAVVNCKESITMTEAAAPKKFEAPKKAAKKAAKKTAAKKTAAKKTVKSAPAERKSSLFRLVDKTKKQWEAFEGQKGAIVAAFKKLNAVGAKSAGATRGALINALPDIPPANVSFYLSKWQAPGIVTKTAAA